MQGERYWQEVIAPHAQSWQCTAVPANAAFLVYASSLHNMGWLPSYSRATASAVAEQLAKQQRLAVSCSSSLPGMCISPHAGAGTLATTTGLPCTAPGHALRKCCRITL